MTDNFALFNETRRPWLDADYLKQKFLSLASQTHPDRVHNASELEKFEASKRYAQLNAAYNCLVEPKLRLLHLLELELGVKPKDIQQIPVALADLFAEVATTCKKADDFLIEKNKLTSPLLQVQMFERGQDWVEKLNFLQRKLNELCEKFAGELKSLDAHWIVTEALSRQEILPKLEELYRLFGYFNRWNSQVQRRIVEVSI